MLFFVYNVCISFFRINIIINLLYFNFFLPEYYPQINFNLCFKNAFTIASFFNYKDRLPVHSCSNVIYEYTCGTRNNSYIESTTKQSKIVFMSIKVYLIEHLDRYLTLNISHHAFIVNSKIIHLPLKIFL